MKKSTLYSIFVAGVLVSGAFGWVAIQDGAWKNLVLSDMDGPVDYSKVGKDRIYSREEGKYKNLNTDEKRLLNKILPKPTERQREWESLPYWEKDTKKDKIKDIDLARRDWVSRSGVIALKGDYAFIYTPKKTNLVGSGNIRSPLFDYFIYNTKEEINFAHNKLQKCGPEDGIWGDDYFVCHTTHNGSTPLLWYYKPGREEFRRIIHSSLLSGWQGGETYYNQVHSDTSVPQLVGSINGNTLTISTYQWRDILESSESKKYEKIRDVSMEIERTHITPPQIVFEKKMNTSDWKTCLNEKYGYEFKYPPDLYVYTRDNPIAYDEWRTTRSVNGITDCNGTQVAFSSLENDSRLNQYAGFQFSLKLLTEQKTIEEVLDGYEEQLDRQDSTGERLFLCPIAEKIGVGKVDTVTVYDIEWMCSSTSKPNTISPNSHNLLMVNKNTTWEMSIYGPFGKEVQSSGVNFFETILSTFRFVDIERKG